MFVRLYKPKGKKEYIFVEDLTKPMLFLFVQVNGTYVPPNDKCVQYTCQNINGELVTKETKTTCPPFNPLDCEPVSISDTLKWSPFPHSVYF